jgi:hypothetical protein
MAFGQIDPARLEGDALTRWYQRSPAEIEEEKRRRSEQAYNAFFSQGEDGQSDNSAAGADEDSAPAGPNQPTWTQVGANRWRGDPASLDRPSQRTSASPDGSYQIAAAGQWTPSGDWICQACHGNSVLPPPTMFTPPRGSGGQPRGSGGSGSSGNNPKQCVIQYENDSNICRWVPGAAARQRCWKSAAQREGHCNNTKGEVGYPPLITR